ncbi:MAG: hypothetical protein UY35_C0003G0021 [Candidatus Saccharibacteria bacterium GW2011_GWC2_48_9]|nr:MAG: hypothetical protein UY35_C0003G0021 [Candidatus Saccharibacteria bacterium GW2011_GWC2_48_9]
MVEKFNATKGFDQKHNETEKTYLPSSAQLLDRFRDHAAKTIQQPYLSHPSEDYSLRLRHTTSASKPDKIDATLKSRGEIVETGLSRDEFTAPVTVNKYQFYNANLPTVHKQRSSPLEAIDIDFYADGYTHVESEEPVAWRRFLNEFDLSDTDFEDVTGEVFTDNEWRAHQQYRREHGGREAFSPHREFETDIALGTILQYAKSRVNISRGRIPVVRLYGRSGSGKSHQLDLLRTGLREHDVPSQVISTDDYNVGTTELTRQNGGLHPANFDHAGVYDLAAASRDTARLLNGESIRDRRFDFATSEPAYGNERVAPPDNTVLFVEGLWARHDTFDFADLTFEIETPLATAIGRRITRDLIDRPEFADPSSNLGYYLECAEPEYRGV